MDSTQEALIEQSQLLISRAIDANESARMHFERAQAAMKHANHAERRASDARAGRAHGAELDEPTDRGDATP